MRAAADLCSGEEPTSVIDCGWEAQVISAPASMDMRMETEDFFCPEGKGCSLYQVVEQCGLVRVYLPKLCVGLS